MGIINTLKRLEINIKLPANPALTPYLSGSTTEKTADGKEDATRTTVRSVPVIFKTQVAINPAKNPKTNRNTSPDSK
jgi:hypothetical protein